jgi:hypothetical protein
VSYGKCGDEEQDFYPISGHIDGTKGNDKQDMIKPLEV